MNKDSCTVVALQRRWPLDGAALRSPLHPCLSQTNPGVSPLRSARLRLLDSCAANGSARALAQRPMGSGAAVGEQRLAWAPLGAERQYGCNIPIQHGQAAGPRRPAPRPQRPVQVRRSAPLSALLPLLLAALVRRTRPTAPGTLSSFLFVCARVLSRRGMWWGVLVGRGGNNR